MVRQCSTKLDSRRWPLRVSFSITDVSAISALILYEEVTGNKINRQLFYLRWADELFQDYNMPKRSAMYIFIRFQALTVSGFEMAKK
jgi:hypothetical protein